MLDPVLYAEVPRVDALTRSFKARAGNTVVMLRSFQRSCKSR